jgi:hypothetical protein
MSVHQVVLIESNLEEILAGEGTPLEDLPISAPEKEALLQRASEARLNPGGSDAGHWTCYRVAPDTSICQWTPPTIYPR